MSQAKNKFKFLGDAVAIGVVNKNFTKKMADLLVDNIQINYKAFLSRIPDDKQERDQELNVYAIREEQGYQINIVGEQVIYDEFGTGDAGAADPHPKKSKYNLNDYNSGPYIRRSHYFKGQYWTFVSPVDWEIAYSQGVPSGRFIFDGLMQTANQLHELSSVFMDELKKAAVKKPVKEDQITMEFLAEGLGIGVE